MKKLIIASLLIAASLYLLMSAFIQDFEINKYEDLSSVKAEGAIERGWVPGVLPASSYEIAETHDLDTNVCYGAFRYKEPDEAAFLGKLKPMNDGNGTLAWGDFLFRVDAKENKVKFRNKSQEAAR